MKPLGILVTGDPVPAARAARGGFDTMIRDAARGAWPGKWTAFDARGTAPLPDPESLAGVIVTGSSSSVTSREPWILAAERWLRGAVERSTPVLGICFGHQLLGSALGGSVAANPRGREIGTVRLDLVAADPLLAGSHPPLHANTTHVDSVVTLL